MTERSAKRRLGRGLEALLGPGGEVIASDEASGEVAVDSIDPNPFQPRRTLGVGELHELTESIRVSGLLQPIVVRPVGADRYELIAGERRLRAVRALGWTAIPAVIREADDLTLLTLALVENLQRDDLSPIDEALGYQKLLAEFNLTQQQVAETVGRDRSTVANAVRLLKLPDEVQALVHEGKLSVGHARALVALEDTELIRRLAKQAVHHQWSVREMEAVASPGPRQRRPRRKANAHVARNPEERRFEDALRKRLQTDVRLVLHGEKGRIEIQFYSNDDLARVAELLLGAPFA